MTFTHRLKGFLYTDKMTAVPVRPKVERDDTHLTVASYNVHKCVGLDRRFDSKRVEDVILELDADVIALQEADLRYGSRRGLLDLSRLKADGGYGHADGHGTKELSHGWHGNALLFRQGVIHGVRKLDLPGVEPRGAIVVDLKLANGLLRVIAAHLGLLRRSRVQQVQSILEAARPDDDRPVVVLGDMNEWRVGRRSALHSFAPHLTPIDKPAASYPSAFPLLHLDRVFISPNLRLIDFEAHVSEKAVIASDHLPVKAVLELPY